MSHGAVPENFAGPGSTAIDQEGTRRLWGRAQLWHKIFPLPGDDLRHRKAFPRVMDRRRKQVRPGEPSEAAMQLCPSVYASWNGYRVNALQIAAGCLERQIARRPTARVDSLQGPIGLAAINGEQIAADTAAHRLDYSEHNIRGDGCVHCSTAARQCL